MHSLNGYQGNELTIMPNIHENDCSEEILLRNNANLLTN